MTGNLRWTVIVLILILLTVGCRSSSGDSPQQPISRRRCEVDGDFAFIPAGKFILGSDRTERDYAYRISAQAAASSPELVSSEEQQLRQKRWFDWESRRQEIYLEAFCISRNLVTNAEYQAFVVATGHREPGISPEDYQQQGFLVHSYTKVKSFLWINGKYPPQQAEHPVVLVSYKDAQAFAHWKGKQDNQNYRLPTAPEWEKAARGKDGRYFPWGNQWRGDATNWAGSGLLNTSVIGSYPLSRSPYGVEDMAGNVFEYTSTLQQRGLQTVTVMKGCSWDDLPGFCRAAYKHTRPIQSRHILLGLTH